MSRWAPVAFGPLLPGICSVMLSGIISQRTYASVILSYIMDCVPESASRIIEERFAQIIAEGLEIHPYIHPCLPAYIPPSLHTYSVPTHYLASNADWCSNSHRTPTLRNFSGVLQI